MNTHRSTRMLTALAPLACALACGSPEDPFVPANTDEAPPPAEPTARPRPAPAPAAVPAECRPPQQAWSDVERLHAAARDSLARLPLFSDTQISLIRSMMAITLASNQQFFKDPADYAKLVELAAAFGIDISQPFDQAADGSWTMSLPGEPDSRLTLEFFAPGDTRRVQGDIFDLDSFLGGVTVESDHTLDEMSADPTLRTNFSFHWEEERPLAYLLRPDGPIPNPFTITVSLYDLVDMAFGGGTSFDQPGDPSLSVLLYLIFIEMSSQAEVFYQANGVDIHYVAKTDRQAAGLIAKGVLGFSVDLEATLGDYVLTVEDGQVGYGEGLEGDVAFRVTGPGVDLGALTHVRSLDGCPTTVWSCAESGKSGAATTCSSAAWDRE